MIAVNNCWAEAGVGLALEPFEDLPVEVFDCEPVLDEEEPVPVDPDPLDPEPLDPVPDEPELLDPEDEPDPELLDPDEPLDVDPEVPLELVPDEEPELLPLAETLPVITALVAKRVTPPLLPPVLVTDPLDVMLCAVAVTWLALVTLPAAKLSAVAVRTRLLV